MAIVHLLALFVLALGLWRLLRKYFVRSSLHNVRGPPRYSIWQGNFPQVADLRTGWDFQQRMADEYGDIVKVHGLLGDEILFVSDPKALHHIYIKEPNTYEDSPFVMFLFLAMGSGDLDASGIDPEVQYRRQHKLLNPVLLSAKYMRALTPMFFEVIDEVIAVQAGDHPQEIDIMKWLSRTSLELIGRGGIGYSFNGLLSDAPNALGDAVKNVWPTLASLSAFQAFVPYMSKVKSPRFLGGLVGLIPMARVRKLKNMVDVMERESREILASKKSAVEKMDDSDSVAEGKDIMTILLKADRQSPNVTRFSDPELIAQMSTLLVTSSDTTSTVVAQTLELLAQRPEIQQKLRQEVTDSMGEQKLSYDDLMELPLLDAICRESLRLFPSVTGVFRQVSQDTMMPLAMPLRGVDGSILNELPLAEGTRVFVNIRASNRNKSVWGGDACEWKPERWLSPLPPSVVDAHIPGVYSHLMTFGSGPKACIGFKLALLQMKAVLYTLVGSFRFSPSKKDIVWISTGVRYPALADDAFKPSLPLVVEKIA